MVTHKAACGQGFTACLVLAQAGCCVMGQVQRIGNATLYEGDCRDIIPTLDPVDAIVTDHPYLLESGGNTTGKMGGKFAKGRYDNSGSIIPVDIEASEFMPLLADVLPQGHAYFMVNNRHVAQTQIAAEAAGFRFHNLLVWDKKTCTPNRWYMKNCEFTLFMFRGKAKYINQCGSRQMISCPNELNTPHETQKPVPLMAHYIENSTAPGQTVLDPFMGSGTTGIAAAQLDRKFIGIERDAKYFDLSCQRIEAALIQGDMLNTMAGAA